MIGRPGNPHNNNKEREALHCVTCLLDDEHLKMLNEIEDAIGPRTYGRRSRVLRKLISEAHRRAFKT